jgi:hypothetical protein
VRVSALWAARRSAGHSDSEPLLWSAINSKEIKQADQQKQIDRNQAELERQRRELEQLKREQREY